MRSQPRRPGFSLRKRCRRTRHRVKPGITGLARINGYRGETNTLEKIEKRVEFDLECIENRSVWFDLYILLRTGPAVLFTREAY